MRWRRSLDLPLQSATSWADARLVRVPLRPRRVGPGWPSRLALAAGVLLVLYAAAAKLEATWAQRWADRQLREAELRRPSPEDGPAEPPAVAAPPLGEPVGRLVIPRLAVDVIALEGVDRGILRRGAGHFPGTALPGQSGNAGFAGHRDSFFRGLRDVRHGDEVRIEAPDGVFRYRVTETRVVGPGEVEVLDPSAGGHLTLVTCHPFDWIGPAPRRFVVRAELLDAPRASS